MSTYSTDEMVPASMPVLSRGKHRNPARGACFMEYTSLLAGEPFSDKPRCVDDKLAAILRGANDKLSDSDRPLLVPLLGRAIGIVAGPPPEVPAPRRARRRWLDRADAETARLRHEVVRRFVAAVPTSSSTDETDLADGGEQIAGLFWDLMSEPTELARSEDYVQRLVERLFLLHECYEEAMDHLGLSRTVPRESVATTEEAAPVVA